MAPPGNPLVSLFVDRKSQQWIVRDPDGAYWAVPSNERGWDQRSPFIPTGETTLEPVPRHYSYLLGLPG